MRFARATESDSSRPVLDRVPPLHLALPPFRLEAVKNKQLPTNTRQEGAFPLLGSFHVCLEVVKQKQLPTNIRQCAFPLLGGFHFRLGLLVINSCRPILDKVPSLY